LPILGTPLRFVDPSAVNLVQKSWKPHMLRNYSLLTTLWPITYCYTVQSAIGVILSSVRLSVCDAVHCGLGVGVQG